MAANIVYNFEMKFINADPNTVYFATVAVFCLLGSILSNYIDKLIIIIATVILGSYLSIRVK